MVTVPGGGFTMGNPTSELGPNERPLASVTISAFYIGKTEVPKPNT